MSTWRFVDDEDEPCSLCVQWTERGRPYWPNGRTVPRIYRHIHPGCAQNVADMVAENECVEPS